MVAWLDSTFAVFDKELLSFFHILAEKYGTILTPIAKFLSVTGDLPLLFIGWLGFALFFIVKDKKLGMWMCGSVIIGAILTTIILKNLVPRPRPYITNETYKAWWQMFKMKVDWDTSFPSGHACASMAGVTAFFLWSKKKHIAWLAYLYPLILGSCRLYLCVHYPSDVLFGYLVGVVACIVCIPFVKLFYLFFEKFPNNFFSRYCTYGTLKDNKQGE